MEAVLKTPTNLSIKRTSKPHHTFTISLFILLALYSIETYSNNLNDKLTSLPPWTESVGRLTIPSTKFEEGEQHSFRETCSASLIGKKGATSSNFILTAWHCFENYFDISQPISFEIKDLQGNIISRVAYRQSSGGGMHADWAILKLDKEVKRSKVKPLEYLILDTSIGDSVSIAGYAKYKKSSENQYDLNYSECTVTEIVIDVRLTDCKAVKGNSGGAVALKIDENNFGLVGIISEGNEENISSFVPIGIFHREVQKYVHKRVNLSRGSTATLPKNARN